MINITGTIQDLKKKLFLLSPDTLYDFVIKKHREKRSLNANSYLWKLCTEIASVINSDKDTVYLMMLKRYGVSHLIPVSKAVPYQDYFKYYEIESTNEKWIWLKVYKGSSQYDTKEMSELLNGVVYECKEMEIPTKEDYEIKKMIEEYEKEYL